ncbi:putative UPF0481 protein At3g02645 [Actinidia eriantha]|uniref:putative UPF0481 protein At3g02645 n=1 Tax=Actinidia eriantha TaxID=165200 RepID=UPI0025879CB7|nr:putative UPF0481 protein At3g02645 [Actinidia eriantha]
METESRSPRRMHVGDYVTVEIIPEDERLISSIKQHMESISVSNCICRVPRNVSRESAMNYFPDLVSIGPFNHGEAKLIATEDKKWRYLNALLSRKPNLEATLDHCVSALKELEPKGLRRRDDPFFNKKDMFFQLRRMIPGDDIILQGNFRQDFNHLLDLIHNCYLPTHPEVQPRVQKKNLCCATKIQESGIGFRKATAESLLDIKFVRGVLEIPPLKVHEYSEIVLRNLIALENCTPDRPMYVTSYALLMEKLAQSNKDVRLLYRRRILTNGLERREEILDLFKKLPVDLKVNDFYYKELCEQMNEYRGANWGVWYKQMKQSNCRFPSAIILAILLLVLTFTGTLFSVLSFSHHHF